MSKPGTNIVPNENMVKIYENVIKNNILNKQFKSIILLGVTKGVYAYIIQKC